MEGTVTDNISDIKLNRIGIERKYDSTGDLAVDSLVRDMYIKKKYCLVPKSAEEARAKGLKFFNGMISSVPRLNIYSDRNRTTVCADVAPARYMLGQAMRDVVDEGRFDYETIQKMSPRLLNVSLLVPVKRNNKYYLLSQIKGHTFGSGEIIAALVAGNVDAKYLSDTNPLKLALSKECMEEIGANLNDIDHTPFSYLLDETKTGHINFASVSRGVDLDKFLDIYESQTKAKLFKDKKREVTGLSLLPIGGSDRSSGYVDCFFPTESGLAEKKEHRDFCLYTRLLVDYLSKQKNAKSLLKTAGF